MERLQIEVYADIACPWCYIGERRLEKALAERPELEVQWWWRPFQLQPRLPRTGMPWEAFARAKFGGMERARQMFAHVAAVGAGEGIHFAFDSIASAPNTEDAHRLILHAQRSGRQREAALALFQAYFAEGADLNQLETLVGIGENIGLEAHALRTSLQGEEGREEVARSQAMAGRLGIQGVPVYVLGERVAVSGAQPPEFFVRAIGMLEREQPGKEARAGEQ